MSGHSKWSKVKHQKATTDVVKGQAFTRASRAITVAVREGGGITDPNTNFHLRLAIENARDVNMPKENIIRAIEKGKGGMGDNLEQISYEAFGSSGVAMLIDVNTDNKLRTVWQIKNILEKSGGTLTSPGAVHYLFRRTGIIVIHKNNWALDQIMEIAVEFGADDVLEKEDTYEIYCPWEKISAITDKIEKKGIVVDNIDIIMKPTSPLKLSEQQLHKIELLISQLDSLDDVVRVYTNI